MTQVPLRVMIADDHDLLRMALAVFIELHDDMVLVGEAQDEAELVQTVVETVPDIILLELKILAVNCTAAIWQIKQAQPDIQIILLTAETDPQCIQEALDAGATSYLPKTSSSDMLTQAIRDTRLQ